MRSEKMDWNKEVKEKSKKKQLKEIQGIIKKWRPGMSRDGFIETWRKKYKYKGIAFELAILRYFNHTDKFTPIGSRICDRHVVVEYPKETKELVEQVNDLYFGEFLYHDTLHSRNDNQTLEEQLNEAYNLAISDIDELPNKIKEEIKMLKKRVKALKDLLKEVEDEQKM